MFTVESVRKSNRRRLLVMLPAIGVGFVGVLIYFAVIARLNDSAIALARPWFGEAAEECARAAVIVLTFVIVLVPVVTAGYFASRYNLVCPQCGKNITGKSDQLVATSCCPECGAVVVSNSRVRSVAVYKRFQARQARTVLRHWFWAWPVGGAVAIAWASLVPSAFQNCPQALWTMPLIGTVAGGWAWLRTFDARFFAPFIVSAILLGFGWHLFWNVV